MNILNIPIDLIKRYKDDKESRELLAFAVCVKCNHVNSVLTNVSIRKVMVVFHVSYAKSKRLINQSKTSSLFSFSGDTLSVPSFKSKEIKLSKSGKSHYQSDYCYKLDRKNYSIKEMSNILSDILLKNLINAMDRNNFTNGEPCYVRNRASVRSLAKSAGICKSSVSRKTMLMVRKGTIRKERAKIQKAILSVNGITLNQWEMETGLHIIINPYDGRGYYVLPCFYTITDRRETEKFKHVIWTRRHTKCNTSNSFYEKLEQGLFC